MSFAPRPLLAAWLGELDYPAAWELQRDLFLTRLDGECDDLLMLLEHPPTYTLGRRGVEEDVLYGQQERALRNISLFHVDRGGRATYHGPGQLVGYPIMELGERYDVVGYLRKLEEALILTAGDLGVEATRDPDHTGVWVGRNKLAAIGVKITRGISMHGFAMNVTTDLDMFGGIVPCGIPDRWVTSVESETGRKESTKRVADLAARRLAEVFDRALVWGHPEAFKPSGVSRSATRSRAGNAAVQGALHEVEEGGNG